MPSFPNALPCGPSRPGCRIRSFSSTDRSPCSKPAASQLCCSSLRLSVFWPVAPFLLVLCTQLFGDRSLESGPSSIKKSFRSESTVFATQGTHSAHASSSPASLLATCTQTAALLCRPRSIQLCEWGCGCAAGLPEFQTWLHCFLDKLFHVSVPQFTCLSNGANTAYLMC